MNIDLMKLLTSQAAPKGQVQAQDMLMGLVASKSPESEEILALLEESGGNFEEVLKNLESAKPEESKLIELTNKEQAASLLQTAPAVKQEAKPEIQLQDLNQQTDLGDIKSADASTLSNLQIEKPVIEVRPNTLTSLLNQVKETSSVTTEVTPMAQKFEQLVTLAPSKLTTLQAVKLQALNDNNQMAKMIETLVEEPTLVKSPEVVLIEKELKILNKENLKSKNIPKLQALKAFQSIAPNNKSMFAKSQDINIEEVEAQVAKSELESIAAPVSKSSFEMPQQLKAKTSFSMDNIDPTNEAKLIDQIKNHIIQNKVATDKKIDFTFNHKDLGDISLTVDKLANDQVAVKIVTMTPEAKKFFNDNRQSLSQSLLSSGVNLSEVKLESTAKNFDMNQSSQQEGKFSQSGQPSDQRKQDSERRRELWEQMQQEQA